MNKRANTNSSNDIQNQQNNSQNAYDRFKTKFIAFDLLMLLFIFSGIFLIRKSFLVIDSQNITYKESSNINYNVKLKPNDFYETETLNKDMVYVASLIDKIDADFNYEFIIDKKSNIEFEYDIIGKLIITDRTSDKKTFFEKDYVLLKKTTDSMNNQGEHRINQNVSIDYDYYNNLANKFRIKYGIDVDCKLVIYLNIYEKNNKNNSFNINNNSVMSLTIPLSQKAINITMDYNEVNKTSKLVRDEEIRVDSYLKLILGIIALIIGIYFTYRYIKLLLKLRIKKSKYDKYIKRILNEYDRLIVETATEPIIKNKEVIIINKFQELLDVRDNLRLPIKYYTVRKHEESIFYINHEEEIYLLTIRNTDIK